MLYSREQKAPEHLPKMMPLTIFQIKSLYPYYLTTVFNVKINFEFKGSLVETYTSLETFPYTGIMEGLYITLTVAVSPGVISVTYPLCLCIPYCLVVKSL